MSPKRQQRPLSKDDFNGGNLSIYKHLTRLDCLVAVAEVAFKKYESEQYLRSLSVALLQKIEQLHGEIPQLVIKKTITKSDLDHGQARLAMPMSQCRIPNLDQKLGINKDSKNKIPITVILPNDNLDIKTLNFTIYKNSYVINGSWNKVTKSCDLEEGNTIEVWCFRIVSNLSDEASTSTSAPPTRYGFAIVKR